MGVASSDRERLTPSWSSSGSATPSDSASTIKCPPLSTQFRISAMRGCGSCWRRCGIRSTACAGSVSSSGSERMSVTFHPMRSAKRCAARNSRRRASPEGPTHSCTTHAVVRGEEPRHAEHDQDADRGERDDLAFHANARLGNRSRGARHRRPAACGAHRRIAATRRPARRNTAASPAARLRLRCGSTSSCTPRLCTSSESAPR